MGLATRALVNGSALPTARVDVAARFAADVVLAEEIDHTVRAVRNGVRPITVHAAREVHRLTAAAHQRVPSEAARARSVAVAIAHTAVRSTRCA